MNNDISRLFKLFIEAEKAIESHRKRLNSQSDFDPWLLFKRIDKRQLKCLTEENLYHFLRLHRIESSINEISFVIMSYDSDSSGSMNYNQFLNMTLCQSYYSMSKSHGANQLYLTEETEKLFIPLLLEELKLARGAISALPTIVRKEGFSVQGLVEELKGRSYLTKQNFGYLARFGVTNVNREEVNGLMRRLDLTRSNRVSIEDLNRIFYFPQDRPPSVSIRRRRPISLEPSRSIHRTQQANDGQRETQGNNSRPSRIETQENNYISFNHGDSSQRQRHHENTYQPTTTESNHIRHQSYTHHRNQLASRNTHLPQHFNPRLNLRLGTETYNERPTLFETNYLTTVPTSIIDSQVNTINSIIPPNDQTQIYQGQQRLPAQSTSNIRHNNGQHNSNAILPIRVSNTLRLRQSPERLFQSTTQTSISQPEEETDSLVTLLKKLLDTERAIESEKVKLAHQQDFNMEDAVSIFEAKFNSNRLTLGDIKLGCASFGLFPSMQEVQFLLKRFDLNEKGYLSFADFFDMLIPFKKDLRNEMERRGPNNYYPSFNKANVFNGITKELLKRVLAMLINSEDYLNSLRIALTSVLDNAMVIKRLFGQIDKEGKGYLTSSNLKQFMRDKHIDCTHNDIDLLFIRLDKDRDGQIRYEEFLNELTLTE